MVTLSSLSRDLSPVFSQFSGLPWTIGKPHCLPTSVVPSQLSYSDTNATPLLCLPKGPATQPARLT